MTQQATPLLSLSGQCTAAVAYGRGVNVIAQNDPSVQTFAQATVSGQKVIGIANRAAGAGEFTDVTVFGTVIAEAGAAIAIGARLQVDAQGRVITAVPLAVAAGATAVTSAAANGAAAISGGDAPNYCLGTALQAAGAAGEFIEILIGN